MQEATFKATQVQDFLFGCDQRLLATQWHLDIIIDGEYEDVPKSIVREWFNIHFPSIVSSDYFRLLECDVVQYMKL
jgi:hypothetical protein